MTPMPGDFFLSHISSYAPRKRDWYFAKMTQIGTGSPYTHAGLYLGDGWAIEAVPGGIDVFEWEDEEEPNVVWSTGSIDLTEYQRIRIVDRAYELETMHKQYSFRKFIPVALSLPNLGSFVSYQKSMNDYPRWLQKTFKADSLYCSEFVVDCYRYAGVDLFKKATDFVSPGDLWKVLNKSESNISRREPKARRFDPRSWYPRRQHV
jgi:hypothetical protein